MWGLRQCAAGGGRLAPTRVWLWFPLRPPLDGKTALMASRWRFRDRMVQVPYLHSDGKMHMSRALGQLVVRVSG
jgi:hypothetical protein